MPSLWPQPGEGPTPTLLCAVLEMSGTKVKQYKCYLTTSVNSITKDEFGQFEIEF